MVLNMKLEDVAQAEEFCPQCRERTYYQLADGRRMCRLCRRKYTLKLSRSRLPNATLDGLARAFWEELSAEKAAQKNQVNRKTAQRYYLRIRRALAEQSCQRRIRLGHAIVAENMTADGLTRLLNVLPRVGPGLIIVPLHEAVLTLLADEYDELSRRIWARAGPSYNDMLEWSPQYWADPAKMARDAEHFWCFAQRCLGVYRGGTGGNYRLFIKEIEFRYNQRKKRDVAQLLANMIGED
jgi:hypothetical protein